LGGCWDDVDYESIGEENDKYEFRSAVRYSIGVPRLEVERQVIVAISTSGMCKG
jgi:hypothetical protein